MWCICMCEWRVLVSVVSEDPSACVCLRVCVRVIERERPCGKTILKAKKSEPEFTQSSNQSK